MTQIALRRSRPVLGFGLSDCEVLVGRNMRHIIRNPEQLFQAVLLPVILLLLFRYMFGGAIATGGLSYVNYVMAGLLAISIGFNATVTAVGVADDMRNGLIERFRSMPLLAPAVLIGHVVSGVLRNGISVAVMIGFGLLVGFRPHATVTGWLAVLGLLLLFTVTLSWLAATIGVVSRTVEGASGLSMILVFLPYASSALVPVRTMPGVLRTVVTYQPVSLVIDTVRPLLTGGRVGSTGWIAIVSWLGILAVTVPLAVYCFNRRAAG